MEKRYILLVIAALLLMPSAFAAITVTPNAPAADLTQSSSTVTFNCVAAEDDPLYEISNVSLYIDSVKNQTQAGLTLALDVANVPSGSHTWYCEGVNNASVSASSSTRTFTISATNTAPSFSGTIPNQTFAEDATLSNAFDLDTYFTDSTALTYSASGNSQITPAIAADGQVSFTAAGNWSGSELIRFTASDGSLANTSNYINVSVTPVNDAPYYTTIPAQNMTKNTNKTVTLSAYFFDVEGSTLTYNVSSAPAHMNYTISGATVTLAPEPNWTGTTSITFSASDGNATISSNSVSLVVSAGNATNVTNRAPVLACTPSLLRATIMLGESKALSLTKTDPDGNTMTVQWKKGSEVIESQTADSYTFTPAEAGTFTVTAVVSDGTLESTCAFTVTVESLENYTSSAGDLGSIISEQTESGPRCGDINIDDGETCGNCPADFKCDADKICTNDVCVLKTGSSTALLVIGIVVAVILIGGFAAYKLTTKRDAVTRVRDGRTLSQVEKEQPPIDLHDIYSHEEKPDLGDLPAPKETPLQKYAKQMRAKGVSEEELRKAMKEKGWSDSAINDAMK